MSVFSNPHEFQSKYQNGNALTNLIVNYLPQTMTDRELFSMFVTIGAVENCRVMKDQKTGYSYGFGFVNYVRQEDASRAIQSLNGLEIQNKRLKVSYARPSGEAIKETNLYVTNLPRSLSDHTLHAMFEKFGTIVQKNILRDKLTGLPRGVAFVRYDRREEALEAIRNLDGTIPPGGTERLSVKIAEEHGKQKAAYYAGWQAGFNQSRGGGGGSSAAASRGGLKKPPARLIPGRGPMPPLMMAKRRLSPLPHLMMPKRRPSPPPMLHPHPHPHPHPHHNLSYPLSHLAPRNPMVARGALRQPRTQSRYNPIAFNANPDYDYHYHGWN